MSAIATSYVPRVFVFDVDETLFTNNTKKLSDSAKMGMNLDEGPHYELDVGSERYLDDDPNSVCIQDIWVIAQERFKELFLKMYEVQQKFAGQTPPFTVKLMTLSTYQSSKIKNILDKIYGTSMFSTGAFAIDIYTPSRMFGENWYLTPSLGYFKNPENKSGWTDITKGTIMEREFPTWHKEVLPGLSKENVYLIDDDDANITGAQLKGFSTLHFATQIEKRPDNVLFTEKSDTTFTQCNAWLDEYLV